MDNFQNQNNNNSSSGSQSPPSTPTTLPPLKNPAQSSPFNPSATPYNVFAQHHQHPPQTQFSVFTNPEPSNENLTSPSSLRHSLESSSQRMQLAPMQDQQPQLQRPLVDPARLRPHREQAIHHIRQGNPAHGMHILMTLAQTYGDCESWYYMATVYNDCADSAVENKRSQLQALGTLNDDQIEASLQGVDYENKQMSFYCLKQAARFGHCAAMLDLADSYFFGAEPHVERCLNTSTFFLLRAYNNGMTQALPRVANAYLKGVGVKRDVAKAVEYLERAEGESVYEDAGWMLYHVHSGREGEDGQQFVNPEKALTWVKKAAERGDREAMLELGECFEQGKNGCINDVNAAITWFRKSADLGNLDAMCIMGEVHESPPAGADPKIIQASHEKAVQYFQTAGERGHVESLKLLSDKYVKGEGVPVDKDKAVKLLQLAANQGDAESAHRVGTMFKTGQWVDRDRKKAREMFVQGAENGNVDSLGELMDQWNMK